MVNLKWLLVFLSLLLILPGENIWAAHKNPSPRTGLASWYSKRDKHVRKHTASGMVFDDRKKTCASYHYSFGMRLKVINMENGKSVVCTVNDRGPSKRLRRRVVDLTPAAFRQIADLRQGLAQVRLIPLGKE